MNIEFTDNEMRYGHTPWDYKKDGTFRKGRERDHYYWVQVKKIVPCEEVAVDGKLIGYIRPDEKHIDDGYPLYNEHGNPVQAAIGTIQGSSIHFWDFCVFKENGKWKFNREVIDYRNWCTYPLWICDEDGETPKYIFKENYKSARHRYAWMKYYEQYDAGWDIVPTKRPKDCAEEFDKLYSNSIIDFDIKRMSYVKYRTLEAENL